MIKYLDKPGKRTKPKTTTTSDLIDQIKENEGVGPYPCENIECEGIELNGAPNEIYELLPIHISHIKHKGMGGNPSQDRQRRDNVRIECGACHIRKTIGGFKVTGAEIFDHA